MLFPSKQALSHQISNAIKKKWCKECTGILEEVVSNEAVNVLDRVTENYPIQSANAIAISRMKERLEALEELNDHLCYYVSFLIENLPELIIKTIQSGTHIVLTNEKNGGELQFDNNNSENKGIFPYPTRREHDVLELLEKGLCAKEIATKLFISETTVITHKKNLKKKFNVKNTVELISKIKNKK